MTPAGGSRFASPLGDAGEARAGPRLATLSPSSPVRPRATPLPFAVRLRCTDAHSPSCEHELQAHHLDELVALAREHGALRHGLTAIWYTPERLAKIAAAVTRPGD
jgi:predicted small metal-binding protein